MANFTAQDVKKLRDLTGAGMMDCKKALESSDGDFEKAVEFLRIKGAKDVGKRAERTTANGLVAHRGNALVELNCETDFVAKNLQFQDLAAQIVALVDAQQPADVDALLKSTLADDRTVAEAVENASATLGEKIVVGKIAVVQGQIAIYMHKRNPDLPAQVGVIVGYDGEGEVAESAARGAAMQIAAMRPKFVTRDQVPVDTVESERRIAEETAREEGKPEAALPKIIEGRLNGFFKDVVLLEQSSVQDSKKTVKAMLEADGVTVRDFARFEIGG
ncbi:MAG: elongation factor Ts [Corynebacteriales bacterium]|nr:elongation factor Ts [Mycobacteriales bacterium]